MSASINQNAREYSVVVLDIIRRRWLFLVIPVLLAIPIAAAAVYMSPTKYVAKSLVLLQPGNRGGNTSAYARPQVLEQVMAIEAWLKSDYVLRELLPQIADIKDPNDPKQISALMRITRASISLALIGGSALEVSFESNNARGLGQKLEIILARLMEGLTGPEHGIFNASQFVLVQRNDALRVAEEALDEAIVRAGLQAPEQVKSQLKVLYDSDVSSRNSSIGSEKSSWVAEQPLRSAPASTDQAKTTAEAISADLNVIDELRRYFAVYQQTLAELTTLKERLSTRGGNYVGIFDSAEGVLVVGRPQDPLSGEGSARKLGVAIVFLSIVLGGGFIWLAEIFHTGLRTRGEFEDVSGLPVIARLQRLPRS